MKSNQVSNIRSKHKYRIAWEREREIKIGRDHENLEGFVKYVQKITSPPGGRVSIQEWKIVRVVGYTPTPIRNFWWEKEKCRGKDLQGRTCFLILVRAGFFPPGLSAAPAAITTWLAGRSSKFPEPAGGGAATTYDHLRRSINESAWKIAGFCTGARCSTRGGEKRRSDPRFTCLPTKPNLEIHIRVILITKYLDIKCITFMK